MGTGLHSQCTYLSNASNDNINLFMCSDTHAMHGIINNMYTLYSPFESYYILQELYDFTKTPARVTGIVHTKLLVLTFWNGLYR